MPVPILWPAAKELWEDVSRRLPANSALARSFRSHGPFVGTVGEIAFGHWFRADKAQRSITHVGEFTHDYLIARLGLGAPSGDNVTIEVKTKLRKAMPHGI